MLNRFANCLSTRSRLSVNPENSRLAQTTALLLAALMLSACSVFQSAPEVVDTGPVEQPLPPPLLESYSEGLAMLQQLEEVDDEQERLQQQQNVLQYWQDLSSQYPQYPGIWTNLALNQYQLNSYEESLASLNKAQQINAEFCPAFKLKGMVQRELGQFNDAESSYLAAANCAPQDANIPYNLGILYDLYLGDLDKALVQYQKAQAMLSEPDETLAVWIPDLQRRTGADKADEGGESAEPQVAGE